MRRIAADVFAMVVFSTVLGTAIEIGVVGLTLFQSLQARSMAIPLNIVSGRPYGIFRDWLIRQLGLTPENRVGFALGDITAFVLFQIPLYAIVLFVSGATASQVGVACLSMSLLFAASGRPYGLFLDACRRLFGVAEPLPKFVDSATGECQSNRKDHK